LAFDPGGGVLFLAAADLADQDHGVGLGILGEQLHGVDKVHAVHRVAADADRRALPIPSWVTWWTAS